MAIHARQHHPTTQQSSGNDHASLGARGMHDGRLLAPTEPVVALRLGGRAPLNAPHSDAAQQVVNMPVTTQEASLNR